MSATGTVTTTTEEQAGSSAPVVLKLRKPKNDKKVSWNAQTVDNEHMNKKKSKCCCVYEKPKQFGESDTESEGECDDCCGHVDSKHKQKATEGESKG